MTPCPRRRAITSPSSRPCPSTPARRPLRLAPEILTEVMKHATSGNPDRKFWATRNHSLVSFALVSREWSGCATRLIYGDLRVEWRCEAATLLLRTMRENPSLLPLVHSVRVFCVQKLDVLEANLNKIRLQGPRSLETPWRAELMAPVDWEEGGREAFIQEKMYWIAEERLWESKDAPWLMERDGIDIATSTFFDELLSTLPNIQHLELDQFLDPLVASPSTDLIATLERLRSFRAADTSSRLLDVLIPRLGRVEVLEADLRFTDEEEEDVVDANPIIPYRPFTSSFPLLHTLRTGFGGGGLTTSLVSILASPSITTVHLGLIAVNDLSKHPDLPAHPSILHLHLSGTRQLCELSSLSAILAKSFPSLVSLDFSGWKSAALRLEDLPGTLSSLRISFNKWEEDSRAVRVPDVVRFIREVMYAAAKGKGHGAKLKKLSVKDEGQALKGTAKEWEELVEVVGKAWAQGVWVEVGNH